VGFAFSSQYGKYSRFSRLSLDPLQEKQKVKTLFSIPKIMNAAAIAAAWQLPAPVLLWKLKKTCKKTL
jgi:hypothetical protein